MTALPPVLLTRENEDNASLKSLLLAAGFEVIEWPGVSTEFLAPDDGPAGLLASLKAASWTAFTTRRAVEATARALASSPPDEGATLARALEDSQVAAVGPATESALRARGVDVAWVGDSQGITSFGPQLIERIGKNERTLLIRSRAADQALPDLLRSAGIEVEDRSLHGPGIPEPRREARIQLSAAVFASPGAARCLLSWNPWLQSVRAVAIGPTTANTLGVELGLARITVAESSSPAAQLNAVLSLTED